MNQSPRTAPAFRASPFSSRAPTPYQALPDETRGRIESAFGFDFPNVNIYPDSPTATHLNAHAFTRGNAIHFAPGKFQPHQRAGRRLLAHELTHVVQQRSGRVRPRMQRASLRINRDDRLENEAEAMADRAVASPTPGLADRPVRVRPLANAGSAVHDSVVQGYFQGSPEGALLAFRISNDMKMAVGQDLAEHDFFATRDKISESDKVFEGLQSDIRMKAGSDTLRFQNNGQASELTRVDVQRTLHSGGVESTLSGENLTTPLDCRQTATLALGSDDLGCVYQSPSGSSNRPGGDPAFMKAVIMLDWLQAYRNELETERAQTEERRDDTRGFMRKIRLAREIRGLDKEWDQIEAILQQVAPLWGELMGVNAESKAVDSAGERSDELRDRFELLAHQAANILLQYYDGLTPEEKDAVDQDLQINRYAAPGVGQGFTVSFRATVEDGSLTADQPFRYHYGAVLMESGDDRVTIENFARSRTVVESEAWIFQMYGPASASGQTVHDRYAGEGDTTMAVEPK